MDSKSVGFDLPEEYSTGREQAPDRLVPQEQDCEPCVPAVKSNLHCT
jgi:hypothetical protein